MFIEGLLAQARERLVVIGDGAPLIEAAKLLDNGADLVPVCDAAGRLAGVITKTDVVAQISGCQGVSCTTAAALVMTRDVVTCQSKDALTDVWARMKERHIKNLPVVDETYRPLGVVHARDILQVLLSESKIEEALLRDYVMNVGYR